MSEIYRACASVVVFQKDKPNSKILLLHKPRKNDSWQLPQGGVDEGETSEEAAVRELKEEAGIDVEIIGESPIIYQYEFPDSYRRFRPDNVRGQRLEFFYAVINENTSTGLSTGDEIEVDQSEIDNFKWVSKDDLKGFIKREEYREIVKSLIDEGNNLLG